MGTFDSLDDADPQLRAAAPAEEVTAVDASAEIDDEYDEYDYDEDLDRRWPSGAPTDAGVEADGGEGDGNCAVLTGLLSPLGVFGEGYWRTRAHLRVLDATTGEPRDVPWPALPGEGPAGGAAPPGIVTGGKHPAVELTGLPAAAPDFEPAWPKTTRRDPGVGL